jgi:threonyl-tRNA synthetase
MSKNQSSIMRHSCSHLLAAAIVNLYPDVKLGIGPAIEAGFYYDFLFSQLISDRQLPQVEKKMEELRKKKLRFIKKEISVEKAKKIFKNQPFKLELLADLEKEEKSKKVSLYQLGDPPTNPGQVFVDLCKGPHVKDTSKIGPFKLLSIAGAYWKGDEKNPMLTRIYGTCFSTKKELDQYLWLQEEAKKRDHRKLGRALDLFSQYDEVGPGLILWHPNLSVVREEIELWWRKEHRKRGYQYVYTPHIGKKVLWDRSGHTKFFKELMYPPLTDERGAVYFLKPMNCNFHMLIYKSKPRSYKELPIRWAELGTVYRYELEGVRHGILRPRGFTQDDAHIICTKEQLIPEIEGVLDFALEMNAVFGFKNLHYELSLANPKNREKYAGELKDWQVAGEALRKILNKRRVKYNEGIGEAKFYGPSIDLKAEDALGRLWQGTTIQFDFNLPARFKLTYIGPDGKEHIPYMIHRTLLGSMERFIGVLIEQYAGAFPVWLSPTQVVIIPITDKQIKYSQKVKEELGDQDIRVELDDRSETTSYKIRDAQLQKIPYMLVVGEREVKEKKVAVRIRSGRNLGPVNLKKFLARIKKEIERKK